MSSSSREFRNALGRYPTGVAIISARGEDGKLVGLTANSVTPVGSDPVRLAWSLGVESRTRAVFEEASYFSVNVLASNQISVARQFASSMADRYEGIDYVAAGSQSLPKIHGAIAWYVCRRTDTTEVGDHVMFIGDVVESELADGAPLLYFAGRFAQFH